MKNFVFLASNNIEIVLYLNNAFLFFSHRLGYVDEAASCFRRALRIDPDFLGARENLENVCSHLVERWHFRMLNDITRNESFKNTIQRAVDRGRSRVLDIGAGTGLLR
jgi:type II protein arginine methyltransferase